MIEVRSFDSEFEWNGKPVLGTLIENGNWIHIDLNDYVFVIGLCTDDSWWLFPLEDDDPTIVRGPYTYDYVVALARLLQ